MFTPNFNSNSSNAEPIPPNDGIGFVLRIGRALHTYGYPAHRLESVMAEASRMLGLEGQFFSTPTSIFAAFGPQDAQHTFLIRVEPGGTDLGKLSELDDIIGDVLAGRITAVQGAERVNEVLAAPAKYGRALRVLAFGVVSGASSRFLGGGAREVTTAAMIGIIIGLLSILTAHSNSLKRIFEPIAAFIAAIIAAIFAASFGTHSVSNDVLAGLIVLLPGLTLTVAMIEISTGNWMSGTARLSGALMNLLGIGFGVALGGRIASALIGPAILIRTDPLPRWTEYLALMVAPLAFTILLRAQFKDAIWIVISGALGFAGSRLGMQWLGAELSVFVGALIVGIASNLYSRMLDRTSMVTLVPGILLLVPGSIGFRSVASMMDEKVVSGVETAFKMVLIAVALAAGILISRLILSARRVV